jgi:hypothetical protein
MVTGVTLQSHSVGGNDYCSFTSLACKSGSVGSDGSVASTTASSVYQTRAYTEAI